MIKKVGSSHDGDNLFVKKCVLFLHRGLDKNKQYYLKKNSNNCYSPVVLLMEKEKQDDDFDLICNYLEDTFGFLYLQNNKSDFISLGGYIEDFESEDFVKCYSFDLSYVQQIKEEFPNDVSWIPEWKIDNQICYDKLIDSSLIFCYTRFLLYMNEKEKVEGE